MRTLDIFGYKLIQQFEGLKLQAYQDSVGIWTIGYGNISYINGKKVKKGDEITREQADLMFKSITNKFALDVAKLIDVCLTQNQFNALVSLAYNIGIGAFKGSTLLNKVNVNPNDKSIANEFLKWKYAGGKVIQGLLNRRIKESEVYFS
ncbi:MAG: endolysin/autolysin [Caudoviricetes sp.]|nr:MAG: endolysin/autolysin [Caudoviricetes sp.]